MLAQVARLGGATLWRCATEFRRKADMRRLAASVRILSLDERITVSTRA